MQAEPTTDATRSTLSRTVRRLREISLALDEGGALGSEKELMDQLCVSRPTLRQAARVVENDQLLQIRRGVRGGYYACRPDSRHVVQAPALYLRLQQATLGDVQAAVRVLAPEVAAAAAACPDSALVAELQAFDAHRRSAGVDTVPDLLRSESELAHLLSRMSGNTAFTLFLDIAYAFGALEQDLKLYEAPEIRADQKAMQLQLCEAVLHHDVTRARATSERRSDVIGALVDAAQVVTPGRAT